MRAALIGAQETDATENQVLQLLPPEIRQQILRAGQPITFRHGQLIHPTISEVRYMFFVREGLVLTQASYNEGAIGTGVIGKTGVLGAMAALGVSRSSTRALCATDGKALRLPVERARELAETYPALRQVLIEQAYAQYNAIGAITCCNSMHRAYQKLQRWLLVAQFHAETPEICVSHEFIAKALGVRRPTVTEALKQMETAGAVRTARRCVIIASEEALLDGSCGCHKRIIREYRLAADSQRKIVG